MNCNEIQCDLNDLSNNKQNNIQFQDEGVNLGTPGSINTVNFVGDCIQAVKVGSKLNVYVNCPQIPTTTTTSSTSTTTSSTTTTTTVAPCNCYSIENLTAIPVIYTWKPCGSNILTGSVLNALSIQYFCANPENVPQQIAGIIDVCLVGGCGICSSLITTTTTSTSTTSTTTEAPTTTTTTSSTSTTSTTTQEPTTTTTTTEEPTTTTTTTVEPSTTTTTTL